MNLNIALNLKNKVGGSSFCENLPAEKSESDSDQFLKFLSREKKGVDLKITESKPLKKEGEASKFTNEDDLFHSLMVAENSDLRKNIDESTHASNTDSESPQYKKLGVTVPALILTQQNLSSKDLTSESVGFVSDNTGSKSIGDLDSLVHGNACESPKIQEKQLGYSVRDSFLKENHDDESYDHKLKENKAPEADIKDFYPKDYAVVHNKAKRMQNGEQPINPIVQKFLSDGAESSQVYLAEKKPSEGVFSGVAVPFSVSYLNDSIASHSTLNGSIDITKFNSFLIEEIKTAKDVGELKKEMTVNIRPSMFGDITITITNGADGYLVSLVTTSQAATNYLSLLKKGIEKSSNTKISIGSTRIDSKGNLSVVDFKNSEHVFKQQGR